MGEGASKSGSILRKKATDQASWLPGYVPDSRVAIYEYRPAASSDYKSFPSIYH